MERIILTADEGYEFTVKHPHEVADCGDTFSVAEYTQSDGLILHIAPKASPNGQIIAAWLAAQ